MNPRKPRPKATSLRIAEARELARIDAVGQQLERVRAVKTLRAMLDELRVSPLPSSTRLVAQRLKALEVAIEVLSTEGAG